MQERVLTFLPQFELYAYGDYLGCLKKEFTLFTPRFVFDCSDWQVEGSWTEWDYAITSPSQGRYATLPCGRNAIVLPVRNSNSVLAVLPPSTDTFR